MDCSDKKYEKREDKMISGFSPEVQQKLNYYVYRLIDPRNGQTFYVSKRKGNRILDHVKGTLARYDGVNDESSEDPNKLRIIHEIIDDGLEVIHVIQRWNLTEKEAFEVEAALIDAYSGLSNIQQGHNHEFGVTNALLLERRYSMKVYEEPKDFKYMIIKVRESRVDEFRIDSLDSRYEATRWCWKINPRSIDEYKYVFSVTDGIVKEVYKINEWIKVEEQVRYAFNGEKAEESIRSRFVNKRIPDKYCVKGMASPVLFSKNVI